MRHALAAAAALALAGCAGAPPRPPAWPDARCEPSQAARLLASFDGRRDPALAAVVCRLLESSTGRELASQWLEKGYRTRVRWDSLPGKLWEVQGQLEVAGTGAVTDHFTLVRLNRLLLRLPTADSAAEALAHEVFGHLMAKKAMPPGDPAGGLLAYSRDDEARASVIGWLVARDLGRRQLNREYLAFMKGPRELDAALDACTVATAMTLTPEQMARPGDAFRARRERVEALLRSRPDRAADLRPIAAKLDELAALFAKPGNERAFSELFGKARASPGARALHEDAEAWSARLRAGGPRAIETSQPAAYTGAGKATHP
jgi:hypothetical protein